MNTIYADIGISCNEVYRLSASDGSEDDLAGQPAGIVRGEEHHDFGDVFGRADAAQWRQGEVVLLELASRAQKPGSAGAFAECGSGVDGVHPDFARSQFHRQHARDGIEARLTGGVHRISGWVQPRSCRTDVDDAAAAWPKVLE